MVARGSNSHFFSFRFTSNSHLFRLNSDSIQFTIFSKSQSCQIQIHFKLKSQSFQMQFRFRITFTSNSILIQFKINFISSLLCAQGQNLLAGECTLLSQGQIGVLFHLSLVQIWYFTHVQIWYFMHVLSLVSSAGDEVPVLMWQCFRVLMFLLSALCPTKHHRNRHALMFNLTNL